MFEGRWAGLPVTPRGCAGPGMHSGVLSRGLGGAGEDWCRVAGEVRSDRQAQSGGHGLMDDAPIFLEAVTVLTYLAFALRPYRGRGACDRHIVGSDIMPARDGDADVYSAGGAFAVAAIVATPVLLFRAVRRMSGTEGWVGLTLDCSSAGNRRAYDGGRGGDLAGVAGMTGLKCGQS